MAIRVLNAEQLDLLRTSLKERGLLMLPSIELTSKLEALADETPPAWAGDLAEEVELDMQLPEDRKGLALAIALALSADRDWTGATVFPDVNNAAGELLPYVTEDLRIRRIVDHAIVYGSLRSWKASLEVIYMLLLGDVRRIFQELSAKTLPARAVQLDRELPHGPIEASMGFLQALIPRLGECWGLDVRKDGARVMTEIAPLLAAEIRHRLVRPFRTIHLSVGEALSFDCAPDSLAISPGFENIQAGSKRNFNLTRGGAVLESTGEFRQQASAHQRVVARCLDTGAQIQLATFEGVRMTGRKCPLAVGQSAVLKAATAVAIDDWTCTCATGSCPRRHRLEGWNLASMPTAQTLGSFLWTAVKGPGKGFKLRSFVTGMLYAILCDGIE
jgi:hypothetical protein